MDGRRSHNKDHGDTVPKKMRDMFLCTLHINIKKRPSRGSVMRAACGLPEKKQISTQLQFFSFESSPDGLSNLYYSYGCIQVLQREERQDYKYSIEGTSINIFESLVLSGPAHPNIFGLFLSPCRHWYVSTGFFVSRKKDNFFNCATLGKTILIIQ